MNSRTRKLTLSALFVAMTLVMLYFASIWPTGQLGLAAVASLFVAAAVIELGIGSAVSVFIVSSLLGMLILPNRTAPLLFILFFGFYPIVKSLIERIRGNALKWLFKLVVFNASLLVMWFFMREMLLGFAGDVQGAFFIFLVGSVIFIIFDFGYTKLIWFYIDRVSKFIRRGKNS